MRQSSMAATIVFSHEIPARRESADPYFGISVM